MGKNFRLFVTGIVRSLTHFVHVVNNGRFQGSEQRIVFSEKIDGSKAKLLFAQRLATRWDAKEAKMVMIGGSG